MTAKTDLTIPQGATWSQGWQITNYDLTGTTWTGRSQVRRSADSSAVLHDFAVSFDGTDVVTLSAQPDESSEWDWRFGVYDVELASADGRVLRIAQGSVTVDPEVTRSE